MKDSIDPVRERELNYGGRCSLSVDEGQRVEKEI
jgi:hypothetical protein